MLTEDQKAAIVAEERFRHDVRQRLANEEPSPSRRAKLWAALNSSFFLWCMSSLVLSAVAFSYQQIAANRSARNARAAAIDRLDTEISTRLAYLASQVSKGIPEKSALTALNEPATVNLANCAFAEYGTRTLRMLLWELHDLAPTEEQAPILAAVKSLQLLAATELLQDSERCLSAEFTLEVRVRGRGKTLADFFGDIDAASTPVPPHPTAPEAAARSEKKSWP